MKSNNKRTRPASTIRSKLEVVLHENETCASAVSETSLQQVLKRLQRAKRIFVLGEGRSGLVVRMFAMRLMHVGKQVFVAGDTTTPPIQEGDWIVALSASGETPVTCLLAKGAAKNRGNLIAITATEDSTLSKAAGCTLIIPAPSKRDFERKGSPNEKSASVQFAGSLFEQQALLIFDSLSLALAEAAHLDPATMWKRHANLE